MALARRSLRLSGLAGVALALTGFWYPLRSLETSQGTGTLTAFRGYSRSTTWDGGFLAVWEDERRSSAFAKIFGARLSPQGALIDDGGIAFATAPGSQWAGAPSCIGSLCLVAWQNDIFGVDARTFDAATGALGSVFQVSGATGREAFAAVANDGARFLVTWTEGDEVRGRFVSAGGTLAPSSVLLATGTSPVWLSTVAGGNAYLIAWLQFNSAGGGYRAYTRVLSADGSPRSGVISMGLAAESWWPAVAFGGDRFLVVWGDQAGNLSGRRFQPDGTPIDVTDQVIVGAALSQSSPGLAFDGSRFIVGYVHDNYSVSVLQVEPATLVPFGVSTGVGTSSASGLTHVSLSMEGTRGLATWERTRFPLKPHFESTLFSTAGAQIARADAGSLDLSAPQRSSQPRAAWFKDRYALAWASHSQSTATPMEKTLDATGERLGTARPLGNAEVEFAGLALAAEGPRACAAWSTGYVMLARCYQPDGPTVEDRLLGPTFWSSSRPAAVATPGQVAFAWGAQSPSGDEVYFREWNRTSGLLGADAGVLLRTSSFIDEVSLAASQSGLLVGWRTGADLRIARFTADAGLLEAPRMIASNAWHHASASNGSDYLVVWAHGYQSEVSAIRVGGDGGFLDTLAFSVSGASPPSLNVFNPSLPAAGWNGREYLVVWPQPPALDGGLSQVRLRRVQSDGTMGPIDVIHSSLFEPEDVGISVGTPGRAIVTWAEYTPASDALEVRARVLAEVPEGQLCFGPAECAVGACVLGLCCVLGGPCASVPDGGILQPDGGVLLPDGGSLLPDGGVGSVEPLRPRTLTVGCGCGTSGGSGLAALLALALLARRRAQPARAASAAASTTLFSRSPALATLTPTPGDPLCSSSARRACKQSSH